MSPIVPLLLLSTVTPPHARPAQDTTVTVKEAKPGYRAEAKVDGKTAMRTALGRVPGGKIQQAELEKEHGRLVYAFDIGQTGKPGVEEVMVDARTGKVVSAKHETAAEEAKEHGAHQMSHRASSTRS